MIITLLNFIAYDGEVGEIFMIWV